jgi:hypothetical protein
MKTQQVSEESDELLWPELRTRYLKTWKLTNMRLGYDGKRKKDVKMKV